MAPSVHVPFPNVELPHGQIYACVFFAFIAWVVVKPVLQALLSPLRRVPGPFLARFTRLWELYAIRKYDFASCNIALHEKHGSIVRLGPNRYSINDADAAKVILGHHNPLDKSKFYLGFGSPFETNTFSEPNIAAHAKMRRPFAALYSNTQLLSYEPFVDTCNSILIKRLREYGTDGKQLDVRELMQFYAFDVIGEITVGSRFGLMEDGGDRYGIIDALDHANKYGAHVGLLPELHSLLGYVIKCFNIRPSVLAVVDFVQPRIEDRVNGRTKSPDDRQDFIDKMLPLEQSGKALRKHTEIACLQNVGAGSDTTAISLAATLGYLAIYPATLARLRQELDEASARGELSEPVTFKEAQKLPYLQAVIQEALRMHPAVGAPMTRIVPSPGLNLAGQFFPAGTEVGVNAWVLHRNTAIFGPDAHVFRPERWLTSDLEERARLDRNFLAFGAGPRVCIGKNISTLEMSKVVPQIVRRFDFEMVRDERTGKVYDWKTYWFTKQDFKCIVRDRKT